MSCQVVYHSCQIYNVFKCIGALQSIKLINDWLQHDQDVVKSLGSNTTSLLKQITYLLNLININLGSSGLIGVNIKLSEIISKESQIPLSEDVALKGILHFVRFYEHYA